MGPFKILPITAFVDPAASQNPQLLVLQEKLATSMIRTVQEISKRSFEALANYQTQTTWLNKAIWYPADYILALFKASQSQRIAYFHQNNRLIDGFAPVKFFDRGTRSFEFIAKKDVKPSDALASALAGVALLDCGAVVQIARYQALLDVLGEDKFNRLFGSEHGQALNIGYHDTAQQPMKLFVNFTSAAKMGRLAAESKGKRTIKIGQVVSFNSIGLLYDAKHPFGMDSNFNVVCITDTIGKQRFTALGIPPEGYSEDELCNFLAERFNDDGSKAEMRASPSNKAHQATLRQAKQYKNKKTTVDKVAGYDPGSPQDFNLQLIQDLIDHKLEEVNIAFVQKHPEARASLTDLGLK